MKKGEVGKEYCDGEVIFEEGGSGDCMYIVQSGQVRISRKTGSQDFTIATLQAGDIFGEMAIFDGLPRSATAAAQGEARVLSMDRKRLFATISRDPTVAFKVLEAASKRIRKLNDEVMKLRER